jgi:hypothetical protein
MTLNLLNLLLLLFIYYFFITKKFINFLAIPSKPLALVFDFSALTLSCIYSLNRAYHSVDFSLNSFD